MGGGFPDTYFQGAYSDYIGLYIGIYRVRVYGLGFPQSRGTLLGVPIIRIIVSWGLHYFWEATIYGESAAI